MTSRTTSSLKLLLCLSILLLPQITQADSGDESWNQVFNFQMKLAEKGNVKAQYILGEMFEKGRGTEKNIETAISWYRQAEKNGHKKAAKRIADIEENIRNQALAKVRAEADEKRRKEEKAQQLIQQKKRITQKKIRQQEAARAQAEKLAQKKQEQKKINPEERAKKIKAAQDRAQAIAEQNAIRQQQAADAALEKYRAATSNPQQQQSSTSSDKYQDPFE